MAVGQFFGSPPSAGLVGVAVLAYPVAGPGDLRLPLGPQRRGLPGFVTTGLLNAVWFELVYFYSHPLLRDRRQRGAFSVTGLLIWPIPVGALRPNDEFSSARMIGLAGVVRPQLLPAVAVAVIAIGGIRKRAHYPPLPGGLALAIVLASALVRLDRPGLAISLHSYVCILPVQGLVRRHLNPFYLLPRLGMGFLGPRQRRDRCFVRSMAH